MKKEVKSLIKKANTLLDSPSEAKSEDLKATLSEIINVLDKGDKSPWWVIVLKILAYAIGLILAGYGTTAAAMTVNLI